MFQHANSTEVIPDVVKLIRGTSVSPPDYPNQSLLQGSLHSIPPFLVLQRHMEAEKCWANSIFQKETAKKKKKRFI